MFYRINNCFRGFAGWRQVFIFGRNIKTMYDQFKVYRFDGATLQVLTEDLRAEGWDITAVWKKGNRKQETYNEKVNSLQLEINGKWFFRQAGNKGFVRLNKLDEDQCTFFLGLLKKHGLYSEPQWGLGIVLYVVYALLVFFIASSQDKAWLSMAFFICALFLTLFLGIAYLRSREEVSATVYKISLVFGIAGYVLTALSSLLCLPLMFNIFRNSLYQKINKIPVS